MADYKFTKKDRKKSGLATRRHYAKMEERGDVITQKDCKIIDEACHRFWVKRGGKPRVDGEILFGGKARPISD